MTISISLLIVRTTSGVSIVASALSRVLILCRRRCVVLLSTRLRCLECLLSVTRCSVIGGNRLSLLSVCVKFVFLWMCVLVWCSVLCTGWPCIALVVSWTVLSIGMLVLIRAVSACVVCVALVVWVSCLKIGMCSYVWLMCLWIVLCCSVTSVTLAVIVKFSRTSLLRLWMMSVMKSRVCATYGSLRLRAVNMLMTCGIMSISRFEIMLTVISVSRTGQVKVLNIRCVSVLCDLDRLVSWDSVLLRCLLDLLVVIAVWKGLLKAVGNLFSVVVSAWFLRICDCSRVISVCCALLGLRLISVVSVLLTGNLVLIRAVSLCVNSVSRVWLSVLCCTCYYVVRCVSGLVVGLVVWCLVIVLILSGPKL